MELCDGHRMESCHERVKTGFPAMIHPWERERRESHPPSPCPHTPKLHQRRRPAVSRKSHPQPFPG
ncbi:hypothetical protein GA0115255_119181, partial [Streptomyces sp. Ncost-T6T-2b]